MNHNIFHALMMSVLILAMPCSALAQDARGPQPAPDPSLNPVTAAIRVYQELISSGNGHRCPMTPSCSRYGAEAFSKHGYLMGWIMTSDRLLRCGRDETRLSETRRVDGENHSYDPVNNNDFWWHRE